MITKLYRIIAFCVLVATQPCFGQNAYSVRTHSLLDADVATSFAIGDIIFVIRDAEVTGNSPTEPDLSKLLGPSVAATKGLPDKTTADLIDQLLGHHYEPRLTLASAISRGDQGFVWKINWQLFPNPGGFSGIPFEYQAYVRSDGSVARPELFFCDHLQESWLSSEEEPLLSHLALADLVSRNPKDVDKDKIRRSAEVAVKEAVSEYNPDLTLRFVGLRQQSFAGVLCGKAAGSDQCSVWAVNFVPSTVAKVNEERTEPFTVWVTSDYVTSQFSRGQWKATKQRTK